MKGFLGLLTIAVAISAVELFVLENRICKGIPDGELLPHPLDCKLFYYCDHSRSVLRICPAGLHFNPQKEVCDWPESAGCQIRITTSTSPPTEPDFKNFEDQILRLSICSGFAYGDLVPNPMDCNKFYQCLGLKAVEKSCPNGLNFNPLEKVCDYPQSAGCRNNTVIHFGYQ